MIAASYVDTNIVFHHTKNNLPQHGISDTLWLFIMRLNCSIPNNFARKFRGSQSLVPMYYYAWYYTSLKCKGLLFQDVYHEQNCDWLYVCTEIFWTLILKKHAQGFSCSPQGPILLTISSLNDAYMRQWAGSSLVPVMACCLFGAKSLPKPNAFLFGIGLLGTNSFLITIIHENAYGNVACKRVAILSIGDELAWFKFD